MVDSAFFHNAGSLSLDTVTALTGALAMMRDGCSLDGSRQFHDVAPLDRAQPNDISFLDNARYIGQFTQSHAGACFVRKKLVSRAPAGMVLLVTETPYGAYALTAQHFYPQPAFIPIVSPLAAIGADCVIGSNVRIDAGALIGESVTIGNDCWIGANCVIEDRVKIGADCRIGANCTLSHARIGNRVILHRGVQIGQDGFGFAPTAKGAVKMPQLGRVLIHDDVEIGSNSCIDRGAGPDTVIGAGSKIDNLVQIGHNVQIGRSVMIAAQCGISGSTIIEDGVMLGGQVGISGHVRLGAGCKVAAQAGIMTDIPNGATYGGFPAQPIRNWHRQTVALSNLPRKVVGKEENERVDE